MNRVLSLFALLLLLLMVAGLGLLWFQPASTPTALAPLASWLHRTVGSEAGSSTRPALPAASTAAASVYGRKPEASVAQTTVPGGTSANISSGPAPIDLAGRNRVARVEVDDKGNVRIEPGQMADEARAVDPDTPPLFDPEAIPTEPPGGRTLVADAGAAIALDTETVERPAPPGQDISPASNDPLSGRAGSLPQNPAAIPPVAARLPEPTKPGAAPRIAAPAEKADIVNEARPTPRTVTPAVTVPNVTGTTKTSPPAQQTLASVSPLRESTRTPDQRPAGQTLTAPVVPVISVAPVAPGPVEASPSVPESPRQTLAASATERLVARETTLAAAPMVPRVLGQIESSEAAAASETPRDERAIPINPVERNPVDQTELPWASLDGSVSAANRARLGMLIPPDAPAPPPASSAAGRRQEASIRNFLDGKVVEFVVGRDQLSDRGRRALDALVPLIQDNRDTNIIIQGHTDSVGDDASNLALSGARALVARDYLIARGVDPARVKGQALGERQPIASNRTAEGRIRNRRIDFVVTERNANQ